MENIKRSPRETATAIAKTISDATKVIEAASIISGYDFFNHNNFKKVGFDLLLKNLCEKYEVSESHIRKVAGWEGKYLQ